MGQANRKDHQGLVKICYQAQGTYLEALKGSLTPHLCVFKPSFSNGVSTYDTVVNFREPAFLVFFFWKASLLIQAGNTGPTLEEEDNSWEGRREPGRMTRGLLVKVVDGRGPK